MSNETSANQETENIYMDYLQESVRVFKIQQRTAIQYMAVALVVFVISGASCYAGLFAPSSLGYTGVRIASWAFWLGLIVATAIVVVGATKAKKQAYEEAAKITQSKPGFDEFFKLHYTRRWWSKQMVTGKKYEQFLSIIGRKESA